MTRAASGRWTVWVANVVVAMWMTGTRAPGAPEARTLAQAQASAQTRPREAAAVTYTGTGRVSGTVVTDTDPRAPVRRALVTLSRQGIEDLRTAATDDEGRFEFRGLPAGTYTIAGTKGGFIRAEYGASRQGGAGRPLVVAADGALEAAPLVLARGAVIAGRVVDAFGRPASNVTVEASQFFLRGGVRTNRITAGAVGRATTNEHGEYRIFGLLPGEYLVFADRATGRPSDVASEVELRWASNQSGPPPPSSRPTRYAAVFFPGVTSAESAAPLSVASGEERLGVDLALQAVPVARVAGVVTGRDGRPAAGALLSIRPARPGPFDRFPIQSWRTLPDGKFAFSDVPPGDHMVWVRGAAVRDDRVVGADWGVARVTVAGRDLDNVAIELQPGLAIDGRVEFAGDTPRPAPLEAVVVLLTPADPNAVPGPPGARVSADGTFRVEGLVPGAYRAQVTVPRAPGPPWLVRSVVLGGRDLLDTPLDVPPGGVAGDLVVTFADRMSTIRGGIADPSGRPVAGLQVFAFSADAAHWFPQSRRVTSAATNDAGAYAISGLPAGPYYLCALTDLDRQQMYDADYLETLVPMAIRVEIGEAEIRTQDLRIGGQMPASPSFRPSSRRASSSARISRSLARRRRPASRRASANRSAAIMLRARSSGVRRSWARMSVRSPPGAARPRRTGT